MQTVGSGSREISPSGVEPVGAAGAAEADPEPSGEAGVPELSEADPLQPPSSRAARATPARTGAVLDFMRISSDIGFRVCIGGSARQSWKSMTAGPLCGIMRSMEAQHRAGVRLIDDHELVGVALEQALATSARLR